MRRRGLVGGVVALAGAAVARLLSPGQAIATHTTSTGSPFADSQALHLGKSNFGAQPLFGGPLNIATERTHIAPTSTILMNVAGNPEPVTRPTRAYFHVSSDGLDVGLRGDSTGHPGVVGSGTIGVLGEGDTGVQGQATTGVGILGTSDSGDGVRGFSSGNLKYGLAGNGTDQAHGLVGTSDNQFGLVGINQNGNNWAGVFINAQANAPAAGKKGLFVQGDFVVLNGTKNAAVKTARFGHRKMYAVEATENVFEDFGTATLKGGKARVELDEIFSETVNTGLRYQVYLTPASADSKGLGVVTRDAKGFTIKELHGGTGNYDFDYRVVAKVRGHEKTRMEQFEPPPMPKTPDRPTPTVIRSDKRDKKDGR